MSMPRYISLLLAALLMAATSPAHAVQTFFFDDMESNDATKWESPEGYWHWQDKPYFIQVDPALRSGVNPIVKYPDLGYLPSAYSGTGCWWFGLESGPGKGTYIGPSFDSGQGTTGGNSNPGDLVNTSGSLTSAPINIPADVSRLTLSFWTWWEIEAPGDDSMTVEVISGGGGTPEIRTIKAIEEGLLVSYDGTDIYKEICLSTGGYNTPGEWGQIYLTLDPVTYAGQSIQLRFTFATKDVKANGYRGWLIDDVRLDDGPAPTLNLAFSTPEAASLVPYSGPVRGNFAPIVTIHGTGLRDDSVVEFTIPGLSPLPAPRTTMVFHSKLYAEVPRKLWDFIPPTPAALKLVNITVTNPDGASQTLTNALALASDAYNPPDIDRLEKPGGGVLEATDDWSNVEMHIIGNYLISPEFPPTDSYVNLREDESLSVSSSGETLIAATVPGQLPLGYRNLIVTTDDGLQDILFAGLLRTDGTSSTSGNLTGHVYNAMTGDPLSNALHGVDVTVSNATPPAHTISPPPGATGAYGPDSLAIGPYEVSVGDGDTQFVTESTQIFIAPNTTTTHNVALVPKNGSGYRFVLTWLDVPGADPNLDLDLEVFVQDNDSCERPDRLGGKTYNSDLGGVAELKVTDMSNVRVESATYTGSKDSISVWVRRSSANDTGDLTASRAVVRIFKDDTLLAAVRVPGSPYGASGWHVADIDVAMDLLRVINAMGTFALDDSMCTDKLCDYVFSSSQLDMPNAAGDMRIEVYNAQQCRWQAETDVDWISLASAIGEGNADIAFTTSANTSASTRVGHIMLGDQALTVMQAGTSSGSGGSGNGSGGGGGGCVMNPHASGVSDILLLALMTLGLRLIRRRA